MSLENPTLGERLRAYAKKSGKRASDMVEEMKFPSKSYSGGQRFFYRHVYGWLTEIKEPSGPSVPIVEDYLRRMKA